MADEEEEAPVITPKRGLARRAIENNATRATDSFEATTTATVPGAYEDLQRPSYSQQYLNELKNTQNSRPSDTPPSDNPAFVSEEIDLASNFSKDLSSYQDGQQGSLIPTDAEIQEKKARRARLAKQQKYNVNPEASEDEAEHDDRPGSDEDEFLTQRDKISLRDARTIGKKEVDTRLIHDDEDLMEGFEDFTNESGRVALGKNAQNEAKARRRADMQDMISAAQEADEDDEDASDRERRDEYEELQTRKGIENMQVNGRKPQPLHDDGPRTPPRITPIPSLSDSIQDLRDKILSIEADRAKKLHRLEEIATEKQEVAQREIDIQRLLAETADKYEKLGAEAGISDKLINGSRQSNLLPNRGLEDLGVSSEGTAEAT